MTQVTINGNAYSDDGTAARDMRSGGFRNWLLPMLGDTMTELGSASTDAAAAAASASAAATSATNASTYAAALQSTSTTSNAIGTGSKTFTTQSGKQFYTGQWVQIVDAASSANWMGGQVTSYSSTTLEVNVTSTGGSGTKTDWKIGPAGSPGATGATGATGSQDLVYLSKSGTYTVLAADKARYFDLTGDGWTLTFSAPATLGANWWALLSNNGTGEVTLAHTSGNIDGLTSFKMYPGEARIVQCDGSTLRSVVVRAFSKTFTAGGTFTKPPGYQWFGGLLWGGGGGGGKSGSTPGAGGGGGGACVPFQIPAASFGATETITVGATANGASSAGAGTAGNESSIGSLLSAFGGGGGGGNGSSDYYGGGGGGALSVGTAGGSNTVAGGEPGGGNSTTATATGQGLGGGASAQGSAFGGGGGANPGGATEACLYGGGGGGGVSNGGTLRAAGSSKFGGAGGAASDSGNGTAGTAPGGGGGATRTGTTAGAGARGELRIWGLV